MKIELILAKSACFKTPVNIQEMTICPLHRERLGIGWRRSIIQRSVPEELSGHDDTAKQKAERGCTLLQSKLIEGFTVAGVILVVGQTWRNLQ